MINQQSVINLAIEAGVIDSADINSIHISPEYIDDLTRFALLVTEDCAKLCEAHVGLLDSSGEGRFWAAKCAETIRKINGTYIVKHTPGPWEIFSNLEVSSGGKIICEMRGFKDEDDANGRLITAAPDLLEALENLADYVDERAGDNECRPLENARAAIVKAKGEV